MPEIRYKIDFDIFAEIRYIMNTQHKAPLWTQLVIALFYLAVLVAATGMGGDESPQFDLKNPTVVIVLKIAQVLLVSITFIVPVVLFSYVLRAEKTKFLALNKVPTWNYLVIALSICILALPLVSGTAYWNSQMHLPSFLSDVEAWMKTKENTANETIKIFFSTNTLGNMFSNLFVIAFMAGLSEEIFFRGFIQRLFIENKMNYHFAVWITAILFSAIHLQFFGFVPRMLLGGVLGYLYVFTNNLWVPIIAHTVNNGFAVVMAYYTGSLESDPLTKNGEEQISPILVAISAVLVALQLVYLYKLKSKETVS